MQHAVRSFLKRSPVYPVVLRYRKARQIALWRDSGCPLPPPSSVKQEIVATHARQFGTEVLVETGTLFGDMIEATKGIFRRIYSIELDEALFRRAEERFRDNPHVTIIRGDSGNILPELTKTVQAPCLFWLDGHYSGDGTARGADESPIARELSAILANSSADSVILIDDARCFVGRDGYPTLDEVRDVLLSRRPDCIFEVKHDVIRVLPRALPDRRDWI